MEKEQKSEPIKEQITNILKEVEETYRKLKETENKYLTLIKDLEIFCPILTISQTEIPNEIKQIKENNEKKQKKKVTQKKSETEEENIHILKNLLDKQLEIQYEEEMKKVFQKAFAKKIQKLIKESQLEKLKQEKEEIEKEEITFLGKISGDKKIKTERLMIIDLKEKLIINQEKTKKQNVIIEESLSDIYTYAFPSLKRYLSRELLEFVAIAKNNTTLQEMLNQEELKNLIEKKVQKEIEEHEKVKEKEADMQNAKNKREIMQLLEQEKGRTNRKIQSLRAKGLIIQNTEKEDLEKEKFSSEALKKFQNKLKKWNIIEMEQKCFDE